MTPTLTRLSQGPMALAFWMGLAGTRSPGRACDLILTWHGTTRRDAGWLGRQLRFLRRCFDVVPLASLLGGPRTGTRRRVALTFDDGLRSNVTVLYPLLRSLGLTATFYVCPGLIGTGRWLWNHEARQRLRRLDEPARLRLAGDFGRPSPDVESLVEWMKTLSLDERERAEARVRAATPRFSPTAQEREAFDLAGWKELAGLDPAVVTYGSHTMTHAIVNRLTPAQLEHEVGESRRVLEARLGGEVDTFAYPNGDHSPEAIGCVRKHYRSAGSDGTSPLLPGCDPHLLPRHAAPPSVLRLAWRLHAPQPA